MIKLLKILIITLTTLAMFTALDSGTILAQSSSTDAEIRELRQEMERLRNRIDELERKRSEETKAREKAFKLAEEDYTTLGRYVDRRIERFNVFPDSKFFLSGYGTAAFVDSSDDSSTFQASVNPIFHYKLGDRTHFIIEPEIELEEDETEVSLEIGEVDIFLNDYLTLVAGKFILPFNAFSERLHPTWINKLPSLPLVYGHGHGHGGGFQSIVPILSDVGVQLRGGVGLPLLDGSKLNYAFYVTNGPRFVAGEEGGEEEEGHTHEAELRNEGDEHIDEAGSLEFGSNFTDLNSNKAVGGRIGILPIWNVEIGASVMYADAGDEIDVLLLGADAEYHYRGLELRGEFIRLEHDELDGGVEDKNGLYLQGAYRLSDITIDNRQLQQHINRLEPVVRYSLIDQEEENFHQFTFGMDYWIMPSFPLKIAYEFNEDLPNRFFIQFAHGF